MSSDVDPLGYDETPYPSAPYPYSHCDHLAIVAKLFGIAARDATQCRVLEVGCADGANLIPMALALGGSRFVGIDLSERQIAAGRAVIARLELPNIELRRQDLTEFSAEGAAFDYIVAHGVFSWTSREVQTRLLDLIRSCLAPQGVAFVSYNVYPGWQQQKVLREWLLRATSGATSTAARLQQARRLMSVLRNSLVRGTDEQRSLAATLARLESWSDSYLRHDLLEDHNEPQFFSDFASQVEDHGLRFFAEADVASMVGAGLPTELAEGVTRLGGSLVGREQLLDGLTNRAFRQSLLCRAECPARERLDDTVVRSAYVVSMLRSRASPVNGPTRFEGRGGFAVDIAEPAVAAALTQLQNVWPGGMWFDDLRAFLSAQRSVNDAVEQLAQHEQTLVNVLLAGFVERAVELHSLAPAYVTAVSERPVASLLARLQAETSSLVTNLRHDVVQLEPAARRLIGHLDGLHTRDELQHILETIGAAPTERRDIDELLGYFARVGLLQA